MLGLVTLTGGLVHLALGGLLYFYPASGVLGLPPASPVLFARLAGGVIAALGAAQLGAAARPPAALVLAAALADGLSAATLVPYLLAGGESAGAYGRLILWALAATLAALAVLGGVLAAPGSARTATDR